MAGLELKDFVKNSTILEEEHYLKLSEIDQQQEQLKFSTGSKIINRMIGGLRGGELSIWTGRGGSGKSTILNQMAITVAEQKGGVLIYSPELTDSQYKNWTTRQMIPSDHTDFLEKVYENALMFELVSNNIEAKNQYPVKVNYKGNIIGNYIADILVEDKIILSNRDKGFWVRYIIVHFLVKIAFLLVLSRKFHHKYLF